MRRFIETGVVQIRGQHRGRSVLAALRGQGWLLGGAPAVCGLRHVGTAVALTDCVVASVRRSDFVALRMSNPDFARWFEQLVSWDAADTLECTCSS